MRPTTHHRQQASPAIRAHRKRIASLWMLGAARAMDMFSVLGSSTPPVNGHLPVEDARALASDWETVGGDMRHAIREHADEPKA